MQAHSTQGVLENQNMFRPRAKEKRKKDKRGTIQYLSTLQNTGL